MKSIYFLKNKLEELYNELSYLEIKYEYRDYINTHIIEVKPIESFSNDKKYVVKQIGLEDIFEETFPDEEILFISDNVLISIENPILELSALNEECEYQLINTPLPVDYVIDNSPKYEFHNINLISFDIPIPRSKSIWDKIIPKNKKDFDYNQSLFYLNLHHDRNKKSFFYFKEICST
ncbi:hypothetical protein C7447_1011035 [Tenacibaculum adriaticum]|uniref:Uncharacterized protein n=1 Tax=Tenacibaculum adriaticum TaxID=413713 RepID=A0A5S5DWR1_9FLAO|nr:hypothetical protein [Tenacibaculum adriaticum]TYQ00421.1 hypothetical protein C7447_1011035 [Tenacibaculum adriaticum]